MVLSRLGTVSVLVPASFPVSDWGWGTQGIGFLEGWVFWFDIREIGAIEYFCAYQINPGPGFEALRTIEALKGASCVK